MTELRLAIVGFGKIARDRHVPAIAAVLASTLVAIAEPQRRPPDVPHFASLEKLLRDGPEIDAVALCTPPQVRRAQARRGARSGQARDAGKAAGRDRQRDRALIAAAQAAKRTLFATWHSRYAPAVEPARACLPAASIKSRCTIIWKEDVRVWHPGQDWIFGSRRLRRVRSRHQRAVDPDPHPAAAGVRDRRPSSAFPPIARRRSSSSWT